MDLSLILLISSLLCTAFAVFLFVFTLFKSDSEQAALALASNEDPSEKKKNPFFQFSKSMVHNFAIQHAKKIKSLKYRSSIKQKIVYAGLDKELNIDEFIGLQILWGFMVPVFAFIMNLALQMGYPWFLFVAAGGVGIYFPHLYCKKLAQFRQTSVGKDLPFFIDLLALSIEAGLDFIGSIQKITEKAKKESVLAAEFLIVLKDIKLGSSRSEALGKLTQRLQSAPVQSFVTMIQDADETGASVATVLKAKSEQMRYERFNNAEKEGAKASQKILIPMMMFIMPAVLITVFAPIALQFVYKKGG